jgi:hypothetical protein
VYLVNKVGEDEDDDDRQNRITSAYRFLQLLNISPPPTLYNSHMDAS